MKKHSTNLVNFKPTKELHMKDKEILSVIFANEPIQLWVTSRNIYKIFMMEWKFTNAIYVTRQVVKKIWPKSYSIAYFVLVSLYSIVHQKYFDHYSQTKTHFTSKYQCLKWIFFYIHLQAFGQSFDLKRHIQNVHEGLKHNKCNYCGQAFTETSNLNR